VGSDFAYLLEKPLKVKLSTASVRPTVYRSDSTDGPRVATSGAW
jgi:hypothetical protein